MVKQVECSQQPLNVTFHTTRPTLLAAGLVDGTIEMHDFSCLLEERATTGDKEDEYDTIVSSTEAFSSGSCRSVLFSKYDSGLVVVGGSNGTLGGWDVERLGSFSATDAAAAPLWRVESVVSSTQTKEPEKLKTGMQVIHEYSPHCWVSGDENGCLRVWDVRQFHRYSAQQSSSSSSQPAVATFSKRHDDYISAITTAGDPACLLATSADGCLSVYDIRNPAEPTFTRMSDNQEDELLSLSVIKSGQKVICGTATGVLGVFSFGTWGDVSDRYPGHGASVDAMLAVNESTLLLGMGNGLLRLGTCVVVVVWYWIL